jgi:hypothetical protein
MLNNCKSLKIKKIHIFTGFQYFFLFILFIVASCSPTKYLNEGEHFLKGFEIKVDDKNEEKNIMNYSPGDYVKQKPNKPLFGIYPYARIYNMVNPAKMEKREAKRKPKEDKMNMKRLAKGKETKERFHFDRWLHKIGEAPVVYSEVQTKKSTGQITSLLKNKGYFNAATTYKAKPKKKMMGVTYNITPGKPYIIRNYSDSIEDQEIAKLLKTYFKYSHIQTGAYVDVTYFDTERANITELLLENGYYRFAKDYIFFDVDTFIGNHQADVKITIKNPSIINTDGEKVPDKHKQYYFNDISIYPDYMPEAIVKKDKEEVINYDTVPGKGNITFYIAKKNKYTKAVLTRGLTIDRDSLYRASKAKGSFAYYGSLANFRLVNFDFYEPDKTNPGDSGKNYLNSKIKLTPLTPQSFTIELEGNTTAGKYGMASNLLYQHLNIFGGAEILDLKFKIELNNQDPGVRVENSYFSETEYGVTASIRFPNMVLPFNTRNFYLKYFPKTAFSLGYNYRYNANYRRNILSGSFGYVWKSKDVFTHELNVLEFSSVKLTNMDSTYLVDLINSEQFEEKYDHMIIGSSYTFTYNTQKIKKSRDFIFLKAKIELAGNLINLASSTFKRNKLGFGSYKDQVLHTYHKNVWSEAQIQQEIDSLNTNMPSFYTIADIPYSQYFKAEFDFRYYQILNTKNELVYRINPGIILPYGNSFYSPQEKMFFLGGASSMRAWPARSLGPGSYKQSDTLLYQYGDVKLEMNLEYRFKLFWMIEAALFADAGNIWSISKYEPNESKKFKFDRFYKEIALGVGAGLRFDFSFFVIRFDFGFRQYDPSISDGSKWLGLSGFKGDNWTFNFGIGYPF